MKYYFFLLIVLFLVSCENKPKLIQNNQTKISSNESINLWKDSVIIENQWCKIMHSKIDSITSENSFFENQDYNKNKLDTTLSKKYLSKLYDPTFVYILSKQYETKDFFTLILYNYIDCESNYILVSIDKKSFNLIDRKTVMYYPGDCSETNSKMTTTFNGKFFNSHTILDYWTSNDSTETDSEKMNIHKISETIDSCEILDNGIIKYKRKEKEKIVP